MSGTGDWLSDNWVAIVAAIISGLAALASIVAARKSISAQNRLLEIEEQREEDRVRRGQRAKLTGFIVKDDSRKGPRFTLEIKNLGEAEARGVTVLLDGVAILEHPVIPKQQLPQPPSTGFTVGPQAHVRYILGPTQEVSGPFKLDLTWRDDSGEVGRYRSTLTIF